MEFLYILIGFIVGMFISSVLCSGMISRGTFWFDDSRERKTLYRIEMNDSPEQLSKSTVLILKVRKRNLDEINKEEK